jgi:catechol 2,3-dioxygenase-like lactoylglutathione lyase family enzyme
MGFEWRLGLSDVTNLKEDAVSTTKTGVSKIANVVIPVADVDRAIDFYVGTLGLEKRVDVPFGEQYRWVEVAPAGAETTIAIAPPGPNGTTGDRDTGITLYTDDLDGYYAELKSRGVDVDAEISRMGAPVPPMFWFRDQENNTLLVVGPA